MWTNVLLDGLLEGQDFRLGLGCAFRFLLEHIFLPGQEDLLQLFECELAQVASDVCELLLDGFMLRVVSVLLEVQAIDVFNGEEVQQRLGDDPVEFGVAG